MAVLVAGCASGVSPVVSTGTTTLTRTTATTAFVAADWNPEHRPTVAADIHQTTVTIHVGERLQFTARDSDTVNFDVMPVDLTSITYYGSDLTFVGIRAGVTILDIPNYDKHFDCPNGPCAHLNAPLTMKVAVVAAWAGTSAAAPVIPAPIIVSTAVHDETLHLEVGQQLRISGDLRASVYSSDAAGINLDGQLGRVADSGTSSTTTLVAAAPGTQMVGVDDPSGSQGGSSVRLTIVIDA